MNAGELVAWGVRMLQYPEEEESQRKGWDPQRVEQAVGGVRQYRHEVEHWRQWVEVGTMTEQFVKTHGLSAGGAPQLRHRLAEAGGAGRGPDALCGGGPVVVPRRGATPARGGVCVRGGGE